jgi:hypothetical protein
MYVDRGVRARAHVRDPCVRARARVHARHVRVRTRVQQSTCSAQYTHHMYIHLHVESEKDVDKKTRLGSDAHKKQTSRQELRGHDAHSHDAHVCTCSRGEGGGGGEGGDRQKLKGHDACLNVNMCVCGVCIGCCMSSVVLWYTPSQ